LIDNGLNLKEEFNLEPGERDFVGTQLPQGDNYDIGAVEFIKN
jgi:hypothetical protein